MSLHGILRSADGVFELGKTTTIGSGVDCDLQLRSANVEDVHAVIERREDDFCFVLLDSNSAHGTYVNETRLQNSAVRLAHNDVIKFGHGGKPYRIEVRFKQQDNNETICPPLIQPAAAAASARLQFSQSLDSRHVSSRSLNRTRPYTLSQVRPRSAAASYSPSSGDLPFLSASGKVDEGSSDLEMENRLLKMGDELSRLSVFEAECLRKDQVIGELRDEIAQLKKRKRSHEDALLKQVQITVDADQQRRVIATLTEEKNSFKLQHSETAKAVTRLRRESAEKATAVASLRAEVNQLKTQKQQRRDTQAEQLQSQLQRIKVQLQSSERCVQDRARKISLLQGKLDAAHQQMSADREINGTLERKLKQTQVTCQTAQSEAQQLAEMKKEERETWELFCNQMCQLSGLANGRELSRTKNGRDIITEHVSQHEEERQRLHEQIQAMKKELKDIEAEEKECSEVSELIQEAMSKLTASSLHLPEIDEIDIPEKMKWLKDELVRLLKFNADAVERHKQEMGILKDALVNACSGMDEEMQIDQDLTTLVQLLQRELQRRKEQYHLLSERIEQLQNESEGVSATAVASLRSELEAERNRQVASIQAEQEAKMNGVVERERAQFEQQLQEERGRREEVQKGLNEVQQALLRKDDEMSRLNGSVLQAQQMQARLQEELQTIQERETTLRNAAELDRESLEEELRKEIALYREESRQHAVTIVELEEKLLASVAENKDLKASVLLYERRSMEDEDEQEIENAPAVPISSLLPVDQPLILNSDIQEIQKLETLAVTLRKHLSLAEREKEEQASICDGLRRDLAGMQARMSDLISEMDERQKRRIEELTCKAMEQEVVLGQRQEQIEQLEGITRSQAKNLDESRQEIERQQRLLELRVGEVKEQSEEATKLVDEIMKEKRGKDEALAELTTKREELIELKRQHQDFERQEQVVKRQKEAIHQLRERIDVLEDARPLAPSHEQSLRELMLVKRELKELKTTNRKHISTSTSDEDASGVNEGMQTLPTTPVSLREATNALDRSEKSYLSLVRTLSRHLDVSGVEGSKSVLKMDPDSRERVWHGRSKASNLLGNQIKQIQERLERKEMLLEGYEEDLRRLRSFESAKEDTSSKLDGFQREIRDKSAEVQLLRDSLKRSHEELDQVQRLNEALLKRRRFQDQHKQQLEASQRKTGHGHHCMYTEEELHYKLESQKRATKELLRRKNFEMNSLQRDLHSTNVKLNAASERLLESSAKLAESYSS
eukprot:m.48007 g.48007  ORF g.48007 m.48007 type:complete len:1247 (+) comp33852_c0_seq1:52-3792(+)